MTTNQTRALIGELFEALQELDEATRHAARLRTTSCGDKLRAAEDRETEAYLQAQSALAHAKAVAKL